mgnify:FL=1|tara:strand:- start:251 stop:454 length:204 start_codon:yes stop_codon:yes gene_type:complete
MKVKELIAKLSEYQPDDVVVLEVFDTTAYEDLYDFYVDDVEVTPEMKEVRLSLIDTKKNFDLNSKSL